jgi:hypothetical protein
MTTKTIASKLLIKPNTTVWSSHPEHLNLIGELPDGARAVSDLEGAATALFFTDSLASLRETVAVYGDRLKEPEFVWFLYPKGGKADINRDSLWPVVAEHGVRPITQVAVDETWSALRFRPLKEGEAQLTGGKPA